MKNVNLKAARKIVRLIDDGISLIMILLFLILLLYGGYSLWDSKQIYTAAGSAQYQVYKPNSEDTVSFEELRRMNPEVTGWLTVYGTSIDYPIVQGEDNSKYLNTSAEGKYSLAGAIFIDACNSKDFSDYNTFIHGHHMEARAMFGDLAEFAEQKFFDEHMYGELYVDGDRYGIVFFSFSLVDAYDKDIYRPGIRGEEAQGNYLQTLLESAMYVREAGQQHAEHLVLLSTCSSDMTNGRHILAGHLTDEIFENRFPSDELQGVKGNTNLTMEKEMWRIPLWIILIVFLVFLILVLVLIQSCKEEGNDNDDSSK